MADCSLSVIYRLDHVNKTETFKWFEKDTRFSQNVMLKYR